MITSKNNNKLKMVRKYLTSAKARKEAGLFVVEGERICREIPEGLLAEVYVSQDFSDSCDERTEEIQKLLKSAEVVDNSVFKDLSDTVNPQGIIAVVRKPAWSDDAAGSKSENKTVLLDGIRDPGNLGTIIRTAEAAGVSAVYMSPDCVDLYNPKVIRSTMGSIFRVPVFSGDLLPVISKLKASGITVYATSLDAVCSYREKDLSSAAVIIGSEADGVSDEVLKAADDLLIIPMAGQVESLNAAVSAAILMFS